MQILDLGSGAGLRVLSLSTNSVSIGRSDDNDVVIAADSTVSRHHAVLERFNNGWRLRDLRSRNGTYINGIRISAPTDVKPGDRMVVGRAAMQLQDSPDATEQQRTDRATDDEQDGGLTRRELEIVRLVAEGRTDAAIGQTLFISTRTVHSHLDRIRDKTGLRRRADFTRLAQKLGLTTQ